MWLTDGFLVTFFGRWKGAVRIHVSHVHTHESHTANVQGGGGGGFGEPNIGKLKKFGKLKICIKVAGSIIRPCWISQIAAILNQRWQPLKIRNLISQAYFKIFQVFNSLLVEGSL